MTQRWFFCQGPPLWIRDDPMGAILSTQDASSEQRAKEGKGGIVRITALGKCVAGGVGVDLRGPVKRLRFERFG